MITNPEPHDPRSCPMCADEPFGGVIDMSEDKTEARKFDEVVAQIKARREAHYPLGQVYCDYVLEEEKRQELMSADIGTLLDIVASLTASNAEKCKQIETLERLSPFSPGSCMVCGGQPLASGKECVCGGKGTMDEELRGLRIAVLEAGEELSTLRTERETRNNLLREVLNSGVELDDPRLGYRSIQLDKVLITEIETVLAPE